MRRSMKSTRSAEACGAVAIVAAAFGFLPAFLLFFFFMLREEARSGLVTDWMGSRFLPHVLQAYSSHRKNPPFQGTKSMIFLLQSVICPLLFFRQSGESWRTQHDIMNNMAIAGILHVDDSEDDRFLFKRAWQRAG